MEEEKKKEHKETTVKDLELRLDKLKEDNDRLKKRVDYLYQRLFNKHR
jgi:hypothetical protein